MLIEKGKKYKVIGDIIRSSCRRPCSKCEPYIKGILVIGFEESVKERTILGKSISDTNNHHHCAFHPDDLIPFKITNWKEMISK